MNPKEPTASDVAYRFDDASVIVTGAASGIGRAAAVAFADAGAFVVVADIDADAGNMLVEEIGGAARFVRTDVTDEASVAAMVQATIDAHGRIDHAFNNAGIEGPPGRATADLDESTWLRVLDINLSGVWRCMKHELVHMKTAGVGTIVNTSSTAGLASGLNAGVAYAASKHGVIGLTKTAAKEYGRHGIRVNAVCPGGVETPLLERTIGAGAFERARSAAMLATPDEIAGAVLWLSSTAARYVNGHSLLIDNGHLA